MGASRTSCERILPAFPKLIFFFLSLSHAGVIRYANDIRDTPIAAILRNGFFFSVIDNRRLRSRNVIDTLKFNATFMSSIGDEMIKSADSRIDREESMEVIYSKNYYFYSLRFLLIFIQCAND